MSAVATHAIQNFVRPSFQPSSKHPSATKAAVEALLDQASRMLGEFVRRADEVVDGMDSGEHESLAHFEREWDAVQLWLKGRMRQVRRAQAAAERAVAKARWRTGDGGGELSHEDLAEIVLRLDRVRQRIAGALLNTGFETHAKLAALSEACLSLRNGLLT